VDEMTRRLGALMITTYMNVVHTIYGQVGRAKWVDIRHDTTRSASIRH
jgi:hypothetical protein